MSDKGGADAVRTLIEGVKVLSEQQAETLTELAWQEAKRLNNACAAAGYEPSDAIGAALAAAATLISFYVQPGSEKAVTEKAIKYLRKMLRRGYAARDSEDQPKETPDA